MVEYVRIEIEAIGPLIALLQWPHILHNCCWIHFIDNNAAQSALVKGNSSCMSGDHITGITWSTIAKRKVWPWFDRVGTKTNPVDGLSRRIFSGPWKEVEIVEHIKDLLGRP